MGKVERLEGYMCVVAFETQYVVLYLFLKAVLVSLKKRPAHANNSIRLCNSEKLCRHLLSGPLS